MEPLSGAARAALDAYRREHVPDAQRLRRVQQRIAAGAEPAPSRPMRLRMLSVGALTIAVIGATLSFRSRPPASPPLSYEREHARLAPVPHAAVLPAEAASAVTPAKRPTAPAPIQNIVPTSDLPAAPQLAREVPVLAAPEPVVEATAVVEAEPAVTRTQAPKIVQSREAPSLDDEVMQVRTAYDLVREGEPLRALSALREHARRFPDGKLRELAEVARVLALCDAGQLAAARDAAASFARSYPSSIHQSRVREACR